MDGGLGRGALTVTKVPDVVVRGDTTCCAAYESHPQGGISRGGIRVGGCDEVIIHRHEVACAQDPGHAEDHLGLYIALRLGLEGDGGMDGKGYPVPARLECYG